MQSYLEKNVIFFGGKGGVGKTTSASAFALGASRRGKNTLLVSTDPAHNIGDMFGTAVGNEETRIEKRLYAVEIDPEKETDRYIRRVKNHLQQVVSGKMTEEIHRQIDLAKHSPGSDEAALFDRLTDIIREGKKRFDLIVFDTAPTGHTLRLLSLPELMETWINSMLARRKKTQDMAGQWLSDGEEQREDPVYDILLERKRKFADVREVLLNREQTAFIYVLVPEKLPIMETEKAVHLLEDYRMPVSTIIVNRVLPPEAGGDFYRKRKEREAVYLKQLQTVFPEQNHVFVPMLERDVDGLEALQSISDCLFV